MNYSKMYRYLFFLFVVLFCAPLYSTAKKHVKKKIDLQTMINNKSSYSKDIQNTLNALLGKVSNSKDPVVALQKLEVLSLWLTKPTDLAPLALLTNLKELTLRNTGVSDITPLAQLIKLEKLDLAVNHIKDISPLATLKNLKQLQLEYNQVQNIKPLVRLTNLEELYLDSNAINTVKPLAALKKLNRLDACNNHIKDIKPLANLKNLQSFSLSHNQITDISPLAGLITLEFLDLSDNPIKDSAPLAGLVNLQSLYLENNNVTTIQPLKALTKLTRLYLNDNQIEDVSPLANLKNVIILHLNNNRIVNVQPLAGLSNLRDLYLDNNQIADVAPLEQLTNLDKLYLFGNKIKDMKPLTHLKKLKRLDVYGNEMRDKKQLAKLKKHSLLDVDSSFEIACRCGFVKKAQALIALHGVDVNFQKGQEGETPLMTASRFGQEEIVELLLKNKADVNQKNNYGESALHKAISTKLPPSVKVVQIVLEHGADPNCLSSDDRDTEDAYHSTPLLCACEKLSDSLAIENAENAKRYEEIIKLLFAYGATANKGDTSPLEAIQGYYEDVNAINKSYEIMKLLIANGADVNYKNRLGCTPFHWALEIGDKKKIQAMLDAGADSSIGDDDGKTPLDMIRNEELKSFVKNYKKK